MERDEAVLRALNESVESNDFTVYPGIFLTSLRSAGFVVVPVEPTEAMLKAGCKACMYDYDTGFEREESMPDIYKAMLTEFITPDEIERLKMENLFLKGKLRELGVTI